MIRALLLLRQRQHAQRLCQSLFPEGYDGEFFLCGGAFKPVLRRGLQINDLDLWVRDRHAREHLCKALIQRGGVLLRDFHPYCIKFRLDAQIVEITYHNVHQSSLKGILGTFDLAINGMGAHYQNGHVHDVCLTDECWHSLSHRQIHVLEPYLERLKQHHDASLLRTLHRLGQAANELQLDVHSDSEHRLWHLFWNHYSEEERRLARDLYFRTMVTHQNDSHDHLIRRSANTGYVFLPREDEADLAPMELAHHAA